MQYDDGVTAVIRSLGGGGAERVLTAMLNYWAEHGVPASVITTTLADNHAYPLHEDIRCITVPPCIESGLDDCPWNVKHLRQAIEMERHKIVISFMEKSNLPSILATAGLPVRLVIAERIDPRLHMQYSEYKKYLIYKLYPLADALVVQTQSVKKGWASLFMPEEKTFVINNMVTVDDSVQHHLPLPEKFLCCMGRLASRKGFRGLLDILPEIFARHPEQSLVILGEGADRHALMAQISAMGLTEKVFLLGFLKAPHSILKQATLFIFPSLFEGFPNALIEAMYVGLAPVSFDCPSGPSEIIQSGENGILVPVNNYSKMAEAILDLLDNPEKCARIARNAKIWAEEAWNLEKIMSLWNHLRMQLLAMPPQQFPHPEIPNIFAASDKD